MGSMRPTAIKEEFVEIDGSTFKPNLPFGEFIASLWYFPFVLAWIIYIGLTINSSFFFGDINYFRLYLFRFLFLFFICS